MRRRASVCFTRQLGAVAIVLLITVVEGRPQQKTAGPNAAPDGALLDSLRDVQAQVREINSTLLELKAEVGRSRQEVLGLREELQETREQLASLKRELSDRRGQSITLAAAAPASGQNIGADPRPPEATVNQRLTKLEEDLQLLNSKTEDQYQTKVESASKYRVRLSGIALLNVFGNHGTVDNQDLPTLARAASSLNTNGNFGATIRQSLLGLELFGPTLGGAKSSAEMQFDFFGGFPNTLDGVTAGLARLRTATVHLDWPHTSVIAGQDAPFFSPLSPTSLASLGLPAFAYSGNLWTWTPQIRVEHRLSLSEASNVLFQFGILDPLTGEPPNNQFYRLPQAGEGGRQPAYATRLGWTHSAFGHPLTLGAGGYYARQNWGFGRTVDSWASTADWNLPLGSWFSITGEFYRGRALGGLGGGIGRSVLFSGPSTDPSTSVLGLNAEGGWAQLKFRPTEKLEFNGAAGEDDTLASDLRRFSQPQSYIDVSVARNRSTSVNAIYHARSNLLFGIEYRRIRTTEIEAARYAAEQFNLSVGVLF